MRIRLRQNDLRSFVPRPSILFISAAVHGLVIASLGGWKTPNAPTRPRYEVWMLDTHLPKDSKRLIWYRVRTKIPAVSAESSSTTRTPAGRSKVAVVMPNPVPAAKQAVLQPNTTIRLTYAPPLPNVLVLSTPVPRPPPPVERKVFQPPVQKVGKGLSPEASQLRVPDTLLPMQVQASPTQMGKLFVPPPPQGKEQGSGPGPAALETPTSLAIPGGTTLAALVIGPDPSSKLGGTIPVGNLPAHFGSSTGTGTDAVAGNVKDAPLALPNVVVEGSRGAASGNIAVLAPRPPANIPRSTTNIKPPTALPDRVTVSAPLYPASRRLPGFVEAQFAARTAYVSLIETFVGAEHGNNWMLWFAERTHGPAAAPHMRPPEPLQKVDSRWAIVPPGQKHAPVVRLAAVIRKDGSVGETRLLQGSDGPYGAIAIAAVQDLHFAPGSRYGAPVDVDVVLEIPLSGGTIESKR
jgi:hypothetical protein